MWDDEADQEPHRLSDYRVAASMSEPAGFDEVQAIPCIRCREPIYQRRLRRWGWRPLERCVTCTSQLWYRWTLEDRLAAKLWRDGAGEAT